jgi:hypothetical protein
MSCSKCYKNVKPINNTAFARIRSNGDPLLDPEIDESASNRNIDSVERIATGRYRVHFKDGIFNGEPDKRSPLVFINACGESDASGNSVCVFADYNSAIVKLPNDLSDFEVLVMQANCL